MDRQAALRRAIDAQVRRDSADSDPGSRLESAFCDVAICPEPEATPEVVDGWLRYQAAREAGLIPKPIDWQARVDAVGPDGVVLEHKTGHI